MPLLEYAITSVRELSGLKIPCISFLRKAPKTNV